MVLEQQPAAMLVMSMIYAMKTIRFEVSKSCANFKTIIMKALLGKVVDVNFFSNLIQ